MATPKDSAPNARVSRSRDLGEILHQLCEAIDILECAFSVLQDGEPGKESTCFALGLRLLNGTYDTFDKALVGMADSDA